MNTRTLLVITLFLSTSSACFEAPDTTSCVTNADCFLLESCRDGSCVRASEDGTSGEAQWPHKECAEAGLADPAACGDGLCDREIGEAQSNCGRDCTCQDGKCDPSEVGLCELCSAVCDFDNECEEGEAAGCSDCPVCGDALCELGELATCPRDCSGRRAAPLVVFVNAVQVESGAFFLSTPSRPQLSAGLAPGDASPTYDVNVGQEVQVDFGRGDGRGGFKTEVAGKSVCFGTVQLVAGTESQRGIGVQVFEGAPEPVDGPSAWVRVVNLSDFLSPVAGSLDETLPANRYAFLEASPWRQVKLGDGTLTLLDVEGNRSAWPFVASAGELIFAVILPGNVGENGERTLRVSFVPTGKLL